MAKKKKNNPIVLILVLIIVVLIGVFVGPKVVHECADCGETFFGAGYEPSQLNEWIDDTYEDAVICEDCAEEQHSLELALGNKTLEDFKLEIF